MVVRIIKSDLVPPRLSRAIMLGDNGIPRFWATLYEITRLSNVSQATARKTLSAIDALYIFVERRFSTSSLDEALFKLDEDRLELYLSSFFNSERNRSVQSGVDVTPRWSAVTAFVFWALEEAGLVVHRDTVPALRTRLAVMRRRYSNLSPNPPPPKLNRLRALPAAVLEEVYRIFDPTSAQNPFRVERQRWRNFCIFLLLLHQGLRRGEALILPVNAVKRGLDPVTLKPRFWLNVVNTHEDEDPRFCDPPSIKNGQSVRQIPIGCTIARAIEHFAANYRGVSRHPFLFLNGRGEPLGVRGLGDLMQRASAALPRGARSVLADFRGLSQEQANDASFSAHDLRHTCAVVRLFQLRSGGVSLDDALMKLRAFFGWSWASQMPQLYARAYWEHHLTNVWNEEFDDRLDALRSVEFAGALR